MSDGPPAARGAVAPLVRIQTHPKRSHLIAPLVASLGDLPVSVVVDPDPDGRPSPLRCYRECVGRPAVGYSHIVVLQDDVTVVAGFQQALTDALTAHPDDLVALFVGGAPRRSAQQVREASWRGDRFCEMARMDWVPTVALAWPTQAAQDFARYLKRVSTTHWADDPIVGGWVNRARRRVVATVPSLVQHPDCEPSLIGRRHKAGRDTNRVAAVFTGAWP